MKCCVPDCGNIGRIRDTNRQNDVTLHSFPKDPKYRAEWLEALSIPNYEPNCRSFVCSQHFKQTDIHVTKNGRKRIKYGAVPYIDESEAPAHKRVCTLCLTLDARMFQLSNKKLSIMYRDIIGMMPNNNVNDRLPMGICFECAAKLQAASAFKCKALISDTLLKEHFLTNEYLTLADVRKFYKKHPNLKTTLTKKDLFKFDNSNISTDFMTEPFVKIEMIPHNDVKEIETINLVENTSTVKDESNTVKSEVDFLSVDDNKSEYMDDDDCDERSKIDFLDNIVFIKNQIDINVENTQNFDDSIDLTTSVETDNAFGYGVEKQTNEDGMQSLVLKEDGSSGIEKQKKVVKRSRAKKTEEDQPARKKRKKKPYVRPSIAIDENVITITTLDHEQLKKEVMERKDSQRYIQSPFKCTVCYKWFPTQDKLERHAYKHSEECGPLVCAICHVRTKSARHMREHVKHQHTNEFACKLCPLVTRNRSVALGHVRFHAGNKYSCPRCSMEFEKQTTYLNHLRLKHMSDCVCELCGYTFISKKGVTAHKQIKHRSSNDSDILQGPYCTICDIKFFNEKAYDRHLRLSSKHIKNENDPHRLSNDPSIKSRRVAGHWEKAVRRPMIRRRDVNLAVDSGPITCEQCGVVLANFRMYASHFKYSHPGSNRTQHTMTNIPYMCEKCGKMFNNTTTLECHMWVHTGQKRFQCDHCNKTFSMKGSLAGHMKIHESVRKLFECNICGKQFSFNFNLTRHMIIHTGLRPFKCDACEKAFRTSGELRAHVDHVHLKKPRPKRIRRKAKKLDQPSLEY